MPRITLTYLQQLKQQGQPIVVLTAYDACFGTLLDQAGVDVLLVGDSLGMVVQGRDSTLPVSVDEMVYHTAMVTRGSQRALVVADMPFMSYATPDQAMANAALLMKEGGAQMVKLEGGREILPIVQALAEKGVPVCAHLGLLPQSVHKLGGYRVQGRDPQSAERILADARALQQAGADLLVLECVPRQLAAQITQTLEIPVIGIGAGAQTDGQVLVLYDILGITPGKRPSFSADFLSQAGSVQAAIDAYVAAVRDRSFPSDAHGFD